jgi:hypothetical protein
MMKSWRKIGDMRMEDGRLLTAWEGGVTPYNMERDFRKEAVREVNKLLAALHRAAASALGAIGDARAVEGLLIALREANWDVRPLGAEALGKIGDARAVEGLLAALHDANARRAAAEALGKIGTLEVLEKLLHRLHRLDIDIYDKDIFPIVRRLAITFSRLHPQPACLPVYPQPLFLRLLKKGFWWVRKLWLDLRMLWPLV